MQLGSCITVAVAVAQAGSCSSDLTPSLETSICCGCGPKKQKKKKFLLKSGGDLGTWALESQTKAKGKTLWRGSLGVPQPGLLRVESTISGCTKQPTTCKRLHIQTAQLQTIGLDRSYKICLFLAAPEVCGNSWVRD